MTILAPNPSMEGITVEGPELLPLNAGEQYRFGFEMDACIGCHSCEVACSEQNGNPSGVQWRTVGEVEARTFPDTRRAGISMACNHCLEPACLQGCPTNAYVKLSNGVVDHHAEDCIGCQYCVWNCPYDVPVFNPARRIVTKCDMCQPRLAAGRAPACVLACPTQAIKVEKVDVATWRADHAAAEGPGLPPAGITISTTRIALPRNLPQPVTVAGHHRIEAEEPHVPLIVLTLLSQVAVGTVWACVLLQSFAVRGEGSGLAEGVGRGAVVAFLAAAVALGASLLHLGRPAVAWKALRNLRTSWLSREVAFLGAFCVASCCVVLAGFLGLSPMVPGIAATLFGAAGVFASGRLYLIAARPMWNSRRTVLGFFATALTMGPLVTVLAVGSSTLSIPWTRALLGVALSGALIQLAVWRHLVRTASRHDAREYHIAARLLRERFRSLSTARLLFGILLVVLLVLALTVTRAGVTTVVVAALACAVAGEVIGRSLFYVTVVPMRGPGRFSGSGS